MCLPGDGIVAEPMVVTNHAITIDAPPQDVWPWLVQMGWGRAGWYTARWVDRLLFPANGPSATDLVVELQGLKVGDFVPDGAPETKTGFIVEELVPNACRSSCTRRVTCRRAARQPPARSSTGHGPSS